MGYGDDPTGDPPSPKIVEMGPIISMETPENELSVHVFAI